MFQRLIYIPTQRAERLPTVRRTDMLIERFLSSLRYVRNDAHFQRNKGLSAAASPPPTTPTNDANPLRGDPCGPCGRLPCGHLRCGHLRPCKGFDCNPLEATTRVAPTESHHWYRREEPPTNSAVVSYQWSVTQLFINY